MLFLIKKKYNLYYSLLNSTNSNPSLRSSTNWIPHSFLNNNSGFPRISLTFLTSDTPRNLFKMCIRDRKEVSLSLLLYYSLNTKENVSISLIHQDMRISQKIRIVHWWQRIVPSWWSMLPRVWSHRRSSYLRSVLWDISRSLHLRCV